MKPLAFPLLTDENIHPGVITYLQNKGADIITVREVGLGASKDVDILQYALEEQRVVLTHDSDFGRLAFVHQKAIPGIIYLRPGHIKSEFTIATLEYLSSLAIDVQFPFIIVAERIRDVIRTRVRQM
ncbi:MAG: hypothetical protein GXP37_06630 [Chloroflexi bacterium]|nr:hypothetical protein [Chloroflexota bacterium]